MKDCIIIIPTYNEKENIAKIIPYTLHLSDRFEVLIIDDGSPDGTAQIVKEMMLQFPNKIHIIERSGKLGLGTAYITGFKWALENGYSYIFEMDADFSHPPEKLLELLDACENKGAQLSIGSRYIKGGGVVNWPFDRLFLSWFASIYVRIVTGMRIKDTTAGFVCYSNAILQQIDLNKIKFVGYAFQIEMKFAVWLTASKIIEVPIVFKDREVGTSKMNGSIIQEAVLGVIKMKWQSLKNNYFYSKLN
ncbi:MAG TPA: polyprenol monophosphomannose synthase [Chitinophagales bacterium]|nr:polyprenol monophosphomannose synthase [Chitinophagales bacterium]MBP6153921.1 polyprenol monophosphomannose synthase [Chitinophagales bacterium]HQV78749.1 polyprenol monophosphomannose synthase [Chitinophagales bacterium]HQW79115.1 polyprenol monophosphomannose synthase [Chitinophagales bacterium]HRB19320.1 polyprenol monophosphomannose synthase [Chitinophagales bacterium]